MKKLIIILTLALAVSLYFLLNKEKPEVITKTETIIEKHFDTIDNTKPTEVKKVYIKIPVVTNDTITKIVYKDKQVNQYKYTDTLKNGIVKSTILADKIYKRDISLVTTDTIIKTEVITVRNKSVLFVGGTIALKKDLEPLNPTLSLYYNRQNKWLGGVGVGYSDGKPNINLTFAIKL